MHGSSHVKYLILSALFIFASVNFTRTTLEILKSSQRLDDLKDEVNELGIQKSQLNNEIEYKQTDDYIDEIARNDLNLVKPGEKVYVIQGDSLEAGDSGVNSDVSVLSGFADRTKESSDIADSNAYQWYKLFFD